MGASRMGYDLFSKQGRSNFKLSASNRAYRLDWKLILGDTFLPLICRVMGHRRYDCNEGYGSPEWACKRCHHYIG